MKVAINGIGVAGPTLAYWLQRHGHDAVLFERAPTPRTGGYLIDFWGLGYDIAERMALLPTLLARSYEMKRMRMFDRRGHQEALVDLAPMREALEGRFISLARSDLAAALLGACKGIPTRFGVSVVAREEDDTGVVATLSDGHREHYDLIVGADGLHSDVRALAFGPESQFERFLGCYVVAFRVRGYSHRDELTYVSHTVQHRQVARVSLREGETLVLLVCRAELMGPAPLPQREAQRLAVRRAFADMGWEVPELLAAMETAEDFYFDRVSQIHLPRWSHGRVALLGDAAASPSLLAGEGAALAMLEAYVLAGEIERAKGHVATALRAFEERLRTFVTAKQKSAVWFRGFFAPATPLGLAIRHLAVHALGFPLIAKPVLARSLQDDFRLPDYPAG